jgi:hypothetical protein
MMSASRGSSASRQEHCDLPLERLLQDVCARTGARGVVCYQSSRLTLLRDLDISPVVYGGSHGADAGLSALYGLPSARFITWLLDDEYASGALPSLKPTAAHKSGEFDDELVLLSRTDAKTYRKCIRGPVAQPWLVTVFLDPERPEKVEYERETTRLAMSLLKTRGEQWQRDVHRLAEVDIHGLMAFETARALPPPRFGQYLRDLLAVVMKLLCPDNTLSLAGSIHIVCDDEFKVNLAPTSDSAAVDGGAEPTNLIDHVVEIPVEDSVLADNMRRSKRLRLLSGWDIGLADPGLLEPYRDVPLDAFKRDVASAGTDPKRCFVRHAVLSGRAHFVQCIRDAWEHEGENYPAIRDLRSFSGVNDALNIVLPLHDVEAGVVLGAINIESTTTAASLDIRPHRVWLAEFLARRFAAAIREMRLHSVRRYIQARRHAIAAHSLDAQRARNILDEACRELARLYGAEEVTLLEPVGMKCAVAGSFRESEDAQAEEIREDVADLVAAAHFITDILLVTNKGSYDVVRPAQFDLAEYPVPFNYLTRATDLEIISIGAWVRAAEEERSRLEATSAPPARVQAMAELHEVRSQVETRVGALAGVSPRDRELWDLLLVPLHLAYEPVVDGAGEATMASLQDPDSVFSAGVLALYSRRPWQNILRLPGSIRMLEPLMEFADLFALVERVKTQITATAVGVVEHSVEFQMLSKLRKAFKYGEFGHFAPYVKGFKDVTVWYVECLLRSQLGAGDRRVLRVSEDQLNALKHMVECFERREGPKSIEWAKHSEHLRNVCSRTELGPLMLAMRNLWNNARSCDYAAEMKVSASETELTVIIQNNVTGSERESLRCERRLHPRGRPGRGRHIAEWLLERAYSNVEVDYSDADSLDWLEVAIHIEKQSGGVPG